VGDSRFGILPRRVVWRFAWGFGVGGCGCGEGGVVAVLLLRFLLLALFSSVLRGCDCDWGVCDFVGLLVCGGGLAVFDRDYWLGRRAGHVHTCRRVCHVPL
jgi:hypothetical protein